VFLCRSPRSSTVLSSRFAHAEPTRITHESPWHHLLKLQSPRQCSRCPRNRKPEVQTGLPRSLGSSRSCLTSPNHLLGLYHHRRLQLRLSLPLGHLGDSNLPQSNKVQIVVTMRNRIPNRRFRSRRYVDPSLIMTDGDLTTISSRYTTRLH
jgi:hypothetical protein